MADMYLNPIPRKLRTPLKWGLIAAAVVAVILMVRWLFF